MGSAPPPPNVERALPLGPPPRVDWSSTPLTTVLTDAERAGLSMELKRASARLTANLKALDVPEVQRQALTLTVRQFVVLTDTLNENALLNCAQTAEFLRQAQARSNRNDRLLLVAFSVAMLGWGAALALALRVVEALGG